MFGQTVLVAEMEVLLSKPISIMLHPLCGL